MLHKCPAVSATTEPGAFARLFGGTARDGDLRDISASDPAAQRRPRRHTTDVIWAASLDGKVDMAWAVAQEVTRGGEAIGSVFFGQRGGDVTVFERRFGAAGDDDGDHADEEWLLGGAGRGGGRGRGRGGGRGRGRGGGNAGAASDSASAAKPAASAPRQPFDRAVRFVERICEQRKKDHGFRPIAELEAYDAAQPLPASEDKEERGTTVKARLRRFPISEHSRELLPMLARTFENRPRSRFALQLPCLAQRKIDGMRCLAYASPVDGRVVAQSRDGWLFGPGVRYVLASLQPLFDGWELRQRALPPASRRVLVLDGELVVPGWTVAQTHALLRRQKQPSDAHVRRLPTTMAVRAYNEALARAVLNGIEEREAQRLARRAGEAAEDAGDSIGAAPSNLLFYLFDLALLMPPQPQVAAAAAAAAAAEPDVAPPPCADATPYRERLQMMRDLLLSRPGVAVNLVLVDCRPVRSYAEADALLEAEARAGGEGLVLRDPEAPYQLGVRANQVQKYKRYRDEEFRVIGYASDIGPAEGAVVWICEVNRDPVSTRILSYRPRDTFNVRPVGSLEERRELYRRAERLIDAGLWLTVGYREIDTRGAPIQPTALGMRFAPAS
jgi:hypothetical protein